jgi:hypothetical protein
MDKRLDNLLDTNALIEYSKVLGTSYRTESSVPSWGYRWFVHPRL